MVLLVLQVLSICVLESQRMFRAAARLTGGLGGHHGNLLSRQELKTQTVPILIFGFSLELWRGTARGQTRHHHTEHRSTMLNLGKTERDQLDVKQLLLGAPAPLQKSKKVTKVQQSLCSGRRLKTAKKVAFSRRYFAMIGKMCCLPTWKKGPEIHRWLVGVQGDLQLGCLGRSRRDTDQSQRKGEPALENLGNP